MAETSQATSSLKQLNKESSGLGANTNAATQAVNSLDKALNSVGFRTIKIKAVADAFKGIKSESIRVGDSIKKSFDGVSFRKFFDKVQTAGKYMDNLAKKAPAAASKINNVMDAVADARNKAKASGDVLDASGLANIRQTVEELANSRNKYIKDTFNEADFGKLKDSLLKAGKAAAKGSKEEYIEAISEIDSGTMLQAVMGNSEKSLTGVFDRLKARAKNFAEAFKTNFSSAIKVVGGLLKGLLIGGIAAGILALVGAVKNAFNVSELGDSIDKTSQKVGMSTDKFQKWAYVLERCGIEASQLKTAMRGLTRSSNGANADYFKQLGIDPSGLSQQQLFEKTVKALQNVSDSTERARLAYKLFGQSSAELAPLLAISSQEVQRLSYQYDLLGATMSGKVVRASADMQDALTDLKAAFQGLKNTLGQVLIPIITKAIIRLTVFIAKVNMVLQALFGVEAEFHDVETSTENVTSNVSKTNNEVKKLKTLISGFDELNIFPSQNNGADLGSFMDDLGDYGSDVTPIIGNILPPEAIAELEDFRDNILPGIIEKFDLLKQKWEEIKEVFADIEYALSGQKWKDAFESGDVGSLTGWDMLLDLIGQVGQGLWDLLNLDGEGGLDKLFEDWFPVGGDLPEEGWFDEWIHRVFYGAENEIGLFEMPGIKEIKEFFDWINETFYNGEGPLGKMPESWEEMFSFEGMFGTWDIESSPIYKFFQSIGDWQVWKDIGDWDIWKASWWKEKWENLKKNIDPKYWWGGNDGEVIGLKQMLGFDKVEQWDIWKASWWKTKWENVTKPITETWDSIKQWWNQNVAPKFTSTYWTGKFQTLTIGLKGVNIAAAVATVWSQVVLWFRNNVASKFTSGYWSQKFSSIKEALSKTSLAETVKKLWTSVQNLWFGKIQPKFTITYWKEKFKTITDGLTNINLVSWITTIWNNTKTWFTTNVAPKFTITYWKNKFNSIVEGLKSISLADIGKSIINGLINTIETGINRLVDKINGSGIISALKTIGVDISLNRIYIPRLAKGGIIDSPTIAEMGEYPGANSNPEIVTPENKMREVFENSNEDIVSVLVQGFRQIVQAIDEKDTTVQIGDTTIAKSAARGNRQYRLQTGQSLF